MNGLRIVTISFSALVLISALWIRTSAAAGAEEAEMEVGADGGTSVGCGDCGQKCKLMCGSRRFRLCCLQYMRKRTLSSSASALSSSPGAGSSPWYAPPKFEPDSGNNNNNNKGNTNELSRQALLRWFPPLSLVSYEDVPQAFPNEY